MSKIKSNSNSPKGSSSEATASKKTIGGTNKSKILSRINKALMLAGMGILLIIIMPHINKPIAGFIGGLAAIKFGLLVLLPEGQIRSGKSGTVVWQKNGRMRVNAFPALVRNSFTTAVRAILSNFSGDWSGLNQSAQNGWLNAEGWTTTNRVGQVVPLKGKQLYITLNTNLDTIGVAPLVLAPDRTSVSVPLYSATPTIDVSSTAITMNLSNDDAAFGIAIDATAPLSFGSNSPGRNKYRTIYALDDSTAIVPADIWTAYTSRFGQPVTGQTIFLVARYIGATNGQMSINSQAFKIIVQA